MPQCPHFSICSGCQLDLSTEPPPIWKEIIEKFKGIVDPKFHVGSLQQWRCRAKLAVQETDKGKVIGLYRAHTHDVVSIPKCLIHHPKINEAISFVLNWINQHPITIYNEITGQGDLRYIQCVVERRTGKIQLSFVLNLKTNNPTQLDDWSRDIDNFLKATGQEKWHSVWVNLNNSKTNTIFSNTWIKIWGEDLIWESLKGVEVCYHPGSFGQANLHLFEELLTIIQEWIPAASNVTELYGGVGAISLSIASKCGWIRCEEWSPLAEDCFNASKAKLPADIANKLTFKTGPAEEHLNLIDGASTIIVDPPRKGLSASVMQKINTSSASQFIYVSCGWTSFQKDYQLLLNAGWLLKDLHGFSFFSGTNHVELLARFDHQQL